jgi:hypothetical protein
MSALTKAEIGRAVTALRELSDIIERLEKATWPESQSDVLRKTDLADETRPRASIDDALRKRAIDTLADLERRAAVLEAARDLDDQHARKAWTIS